MFSAAQLYGALAVNHGGDLHARRACVKLLHCALSGGSSLRVSVYCTVCSAATMMTASS